MEPTYNECCCVLCKSDRYSRRTSDVVILPTITITPVSDCDRLRNRVVALLSAGSGSYILKADVGRVLNG